MSNFPQDIYTEPHPVDVNTLANLGPLRGMAGVWEGLRGLDVKPKAEGPKKQAFLRAYRTATHRPADQRPAVALWPALPHAHHQT